MTELDRVGNSDYFNFRGGVHRFCKSARNARRQREKRWNGSRVMELLHFYSKRFGLFTSMFCKQKKF